MARSGGVLKSVGSFIASLLWFDSKAVKENDNLQSVGDSINDISRTLGGGAVFQTKKEKEEVTRRAQEKIQRNMAETAKYTKQSAETLQNILEELRK